MGEDEDELPRVTGVPVEEDDEEWIPHVSGVPVPAEPEEEGGREELGPSVSAAGTGARVRAGSSDGLRLSLSDLEEVPAPANPPPPLPPLELRASAPKAPLPVRRDRRPGREAPAPPPPPERIDFEAALREPPPRPPVAPSPASAEAGTEPSRPMRWVLLALVLAGLGGTAWLAWGGREPERTAVASTLSAPSVAAAPSAVPAPSLASAAPVPSAAASAGGGESTDSAEPGEPADTAPDRVAPALAEASEGEGADAPRSPRRVRAERPRPSPLARESGGQERGGEDPGASPRAERPSDDLGAIESHSELRREPPPAADRAQAEGNGGTSAAAAVPALADAPSREQVQAALSAVRPAVQACVDGHGTVRVRVSVASSGRVTTALVEDPYWARPPTGSCIARAVRTARFPPFARERFVVLYPFTL